jgi:two-component system, LytTR family, sensor kinase
LAARNIIDTLYLILTKRVVYHSLFWLFLYATLVLIGFDEDQNLAATMLNEFIDLIFYAILVYFNLFYLIPNYLSTKTIIYIGLVVGACILITPIKIFVFFLKFTGLPNYQSQLVNNQSLVFVGSFAVTVLSTVLNIITKWWRFQQEKQDLLTQSMQSELQFLKSQINPHFLFNTLNNLYSLTLTKNDKAPEIVLKLSEIIRYMLYECNERRVMLNREIQYMQNYLDLEKLRQPKNVEISMIVEGNINDQQIAPLMFIPFLENCFKHGLNNHISGDGFVRARFRVQDEDLEFYIENSKPPHIPRMEHPRSGGIGLNNIKQRLNLLYPKDYDLTIEDDPQKYAVTLVLKLNT